MLPLEKNIEGNGDDWNLTGFFLVLSSFKFVYSFINKYYVEKVYQVQINEVGFNNEIGERGGLYHSSKWNVKQT